MLNCFWWLLKIYHQSGVIMRIILTILLIGCFLISANPLPLHAQATVVGSVIDSTNGIVLGGVNVFLSGTKIGTATNSRGHYKLQRIPQGGYRLVVSIIGYKKAVKKIVIGGGEIQTFDFKLEPIIYEMPEIYVGNLDKKWKKNLRNFRNYFIGETKWADSVKILNPEVLRFDKNWWGRFKAEALAPLKIENRALGYSITYYMREFHHGGSRTRWDGDPLFAEMTPVDSSQAAYWRRNRRKAFYGSLRHFMLSLLQDQVKEQGFIIYRIRQDIYGYSPRNQSRTTADRIIKKGNEKYTHRMNFVGRLKIIYTHEDEDPNYLLWSHSFQRGPASVQTSYLELNEHPITIDVNGEILEPYGATQFGYFAFQRLANLTPEGYRPEGYRQTADMK